VVFGSAGVDVVKAVCVCFSMILVFLTTFKSVEICRVLVFG
jgi:hypothetical protein